MNNSGLISCTILSPNYSTRTAKIDRITIHHMAGIGTAESCGQTFASTSRQASANYGIGNDGRIGLYVPEQYRAWTSSSRENDNRAVTIEVSNSAVGGEWPVSDAAYKSLIDLCADICQRNGIERLNYTGDTSGNLTMHCWFAATACPGPYLKARFPQIADAVNAHLMQNNNQEENDMTLDKFKEFWYEMRKELQDNDASTYSIEAREWAVQKGIVAGGSASEFNGMWEDVLTREQMVTLLYRFAKQIGAA